MGLFTYKRLAKKNILIVIFLPIVFPFFQMLSRLNIYQEKEVHGTIKGRLKMPEDLRDGYRPAIKKKKKHSK